MNNRGANGRFVRNPNDFIDLYRLLLSLYQLLPLLTVLIISYFYWDIPKITREVLLKIVCGQSGELCTCKCGNENGSYWKS